MLKRKKSPVRRLVLGGICGTLFTFLAFTFWPIKSLIWPSLFPQLLVFTNENELRPCGGFATAFAEISLLPPRFVIKNTFEITADLGAPKFPLDRVADRQYFWDGGISADLRICAENFLTHFAAADREFSPRNVILVDISSIRDWLEILGGVKTGDEIWTAKNFFAQMTRRVARVDRHDEKSLAERKNPLSELGQKMIWKTISRPHKWPKITRLLEKKIQNGSIFWPQISPERAPNSTDFWVEEWNLGGGKTSGFLAKKWRIRAREIAPNEWKFRLNFSADHLGAEIDQPLSQSFRGFFRLHFPEFLRQSPAEFFVEIAPGQSFSKSFEFDFAGASPEFSVFRARGQQIFADVSVSLFPQKSFESATFEFTENVGKFFGATEPVRKNFFWRENPDHSAPFLTLHQPISFQNLPPKIAAKFSPENFLVELHFNEKIRTENLQISLIDRDFALAETSENPEFLRAERLPDDRTLILAFRAPTPQPNERFSLEISGVADFFGREVDSQKYTVIWR